jgi:RNA polymerase sigma-70 factor (ECF subfamily)
MIAGPADEALRDAHRASFGRLVGWLFRMTGDLALAEDAVAAAFASALTAWRTGGVPDAPEAWLRVAARNQARTALTRRARTAPVDPDALAHLEAEPVEHSPVDDRLALLFVCAHPAIDPRMHAPLMLHVVLGVEAARIARVYLVPAATMGQRLTRAKTKIRDAGIGFELPEADEIELRIDPILQGVYAAYGSADPVVETADVRDDALRAEALRLAELLTELLPKHPETWGLLGLLLHTESRRAGRVTDGAFVPLAEQDTSRWSAPQRRRADHCLQRAAALGRIGRFQLEAAISAVHSARADGVAVDQEAIVTLYRGLLRVAPSVGATIGAAAAMLQNDDPSAAARLLEALPLAAVRHHQPYWVVRAELDAATGDIAAARRSLDIAIGLTIDPALRTSLLRRRAAGTE